MWFSHSPGTWPLCRGREEPELFLWAYAAAKNPVAAKDGSCSLLVGDERRHPKWIRGMKLHWLRTVQ